MLVGHYRLLALALSLAVAVAPRQSNALYDNNAHVTQLTGSNFQRIVHKNNNVVMVEFFAPWCGHCKQLAPMYKKVAKQLRDKVTVAAIDCDAELNKPVCAEHGIQGFPTIKVFYPRQNKKKPGQLKKIASEYQGERSVDAMVESALDRLPLWSVTLLTSGESTIARANVDEFLANEDKWASGLPATLPKAILFTNKPIVAPLMRSLALQVHGRIRVASSRDPKLAKQFGIQRTPTLLVLPSGITDYQEAIKYEDKFQRSKLLAFLEEHAAAATTNKKSQPAKKKVTSDPATTKPKATKATKESKAKQQDTSEVAQFTSQQELDKCVDDTGYCLVMLRKSHESLGKAALAADESHLALLHQLKANDLEAKGPLRVGYLRAPDTEQMSHLLDLDSAAHPALALFVWPNRLYYTYDGDLSDTTSVERFIHDAIALRSPGKPLVYRPQFGARPADAEHDEL